LIPPVNREGSLLLIPVSTPLNYKGNCRKI
jgi:hypothetical protein